MYQRQLSFEESVNRALKVNYCNFGGRASRSEYWWYCLFTVIVNAAIMFLTLFIGRNLGSIVSYVVGLGLLLPGLGLAVRRLHDVGRSGWWLLISLTGIGCLLLLYWYVQSSQMEDNEYGPVPNMVD